MRPLLHVAYGFPIRCLVFSRSFVKRQSTREPEIHRARILHTNVSSAPHDELHLSPYHLNTAHTFGINRVILYLLRPNVISLVSFCTVNWTTFAPDSPAENEEGAETPVESETPAEEEEEVVKTLEQFLAEKAAAKAAAETKAIRKVDSSAYPDAIPMNRDEEEEFLFKVCLPGEIHSPTSALPFPSCFLIHSGRV